MAAISEGARMRKLGRLSLVAGAFVAVAGGAMVAAPSMAAPGGGECTLNGTAQFNPGPGANPSGAFAYKFSGTLTGCNSSANKGADIDGVISAGQAFTLNGTSYTLNGATDSPTGTGSCATGTTEGTSAVVWNGVDGAGKQLVSFIHYTTRSAAAGVVLQGTVVPTVSAVDGSGVATQLSSNRYVSNGAAGVLTFQVADPTQCNTPGGVTTAGIQGVTGIGSQS
jgi:hypothetical protein